MDEQIAARLLCLNREFYQTFAQSFSETRGRLQPGVLRIIEKQIMHNSVLDLGCGNGELARELARRGHSGRYVGLDSSDELLAAARQEQPHPQAHFENADLADPLWQADLSPPYDRIVAFAVLHHLPGDGLRLRLAKEMRGLISGEGRVVLSVWDFLKSERLKARVVDWDSIDMRAQDVDGGDYLLDWRRGGYGLRYVHHFSEEDLADLAVQSGFSVEETFHSDGEGGRLGLYQVWRPVAMA
jgi:2-polyprenyl-3-methyl-5-hydroxy-6-metoxy-1,4-benzoquinol methylase